MPTVGGKKFPYTAKGKAAAKKASKATGKPVKMKDGGLAKKKSDKNDINKLADKPLNQVETKVVNRKTGKDDLEKTRKLGYNNAMFSFKMDRVKRAAEAAKAKRKKQGKDT